jgi:hypothetical protein
MREWRHIATILNLCTKWSELTASRPCLFTSGERAPGIHWTGGWVGPRTSLNATEKKKISYPCWESNSQFLGRTARCYTHRDIQVLHWINADENKISLVAHGEYFQ